MGKLELILNGFGIAGGVLSIIVGWYVLSAKSYFKEKGKNLATKEDIAEITKEVEGVKNNMQFQSKLHEETKLAAIRAFECLDNLYASVIYPHYYRDIDIKAFNEIEKLGKQTSDNYNKAFARLTLYIGNGSMIQQFRDCAKIIQKLNDVFTSANFEKATFVEFKRQVGDLDIEDYKSDDKIDIHTSTKQAYDSVLKRLGLFSEQAGGTLAKQNPLWKESREKLRVSVSQLIKNEHR